MTDTTIESKPQVTNGSTALAATPAQSSPTAAPSGGGLISPFASSSNFETAWRMGKLLAASTMVPAQYQGKPENCIVAIELASRIGVSVLAVMQNLAIVNGKPSFEAKFLIATVNATGRFTPLRFEWSGKAGTNAWACRVRAKEKASDELLEGPWVTWEMATKEGWVGKKGSKWQTMPELMFSYRAASFWQKLFCPEISIGFQTTEEIVDSVPAGALQATATVLPEGLTPGGADNLAAILGLQTKAAQQTDDPAVATKTTGDINTALGLDFDKTTGEIKP